ncbi:unnamed protein product [Acanthosepion pharaonis]|uniref:Uncharacterized protein n=1 Tax=Acanthosepion pharaonis TaxID=158019 RepID=A0A812E2T5_ACAPH|nr:unnamed protein product [Sepia pharaonis]
MLSRRIEMHPGKPFRCTQIICLFTDAKYENSVFHVSRCQSFHYYGAICITPCEWSLLVLYLIHQASIRKLAPIGGVDLSYSLSFSLSLSLSIYLSLSRCGLRVFDLDDSEISRNAEIGMLDLTNWNRRDLFVSNEAVCVNFARKMFSLSASLLD